MRKHFKDKETMAGEASHIEFITNEKTPDDDNAEHFYQEDDKFTWTPEEERKVVFKIDSYLLITIFWMYLLSYMDRTNVGNAYAAGMKEDLGMDSSQYSIALVVFFAFYVAFEIPASYILIKIGPKLFIPTIMLLWGVISCCFSAVHTNGQVVALRCLVGLFEAGFAPGILLILSSWYKKAEQSRRFAAYISAAILSGAFGGIIAGLITEYLEDAKGIAGWRWLFIIEGCGTIFISLIAFSTLLPLPQHMKPNKSFSKRDIQIALRRLQKDNVVNDDGDNISAWQALWLNCKSLRVLLLIVGYMVIVGSSTLSYFYPTLNEGLGYTVFMIQYMTIPIYGSAFILNLLVAFFSDRYMKWRGAYLSILLLAAGVFSIVVVTHYEYKTRYAMLCLMASALWAANALALSYAATTLSDKDSKTRSVGLSLINALGNLAQIYGSYLFPSKDSPKYLMGFGVITGMCFLGGIIYGILAVINYLKLKRIRSNTIFQESDHELEITKRND